MEEARTRSTTIRMTVSRRLSVSQIESFTFGVSVYFGRIFRSVIKASISLHELPADYRP
jgi:hypothetical protein